jgi:hypothetical protein
MLERSQIVQGQNLVGDRQRACIRRRPQHLSRSKALRQDELLPGMPAGPLHFQPGP